MPEPVSAGPERPGVEHRPVVHLEPRHRGGEIPLRASLGWLVDPRVHLDGRLELGLAEHHGDDSYQWRVTAYDSSSKTLGQSPWRDFVVDNNGPKVETKSPSSSGTKKTNFVVTFNEPVKNLTSSTMAIYQSGKARKLPAKVTLSAGKTKATLNPNKNLKPGKKYTVKLLSGITDTWGNKLTLTTWTVTIR